MLEKNIVDQPEVVQAFYDYYYELLVKGASAVEEPPFFLLMGQSGTGKDTSAKALVMALAAINPEIIDKRRAVYDHLFTVKVQLDESSVWGLLGSETGYQGSQFLSPLIKFLVNHSGGRYLIERKKSANGGKEEEYIVENDKWKGQNLPGTLGPESAALYLNELGDWSMLAKDLLLKEFLETGIFRIGSPNGGLDRIEVPGVWVIGSTNEGTELVTNRLADGTINGSPPPYSEMNRRHGDKKDKKEVLRSSLYRTNSLSRQNRTKAEPKGTSEAIIDRIQHSRMILMAPHSPLTQRKIAMMKFERTKKVLGLASSGMYGAIKIEITDRAIVAVQEYDNVAEQNSRPIKDRMRAMVEKPFFDSIQAANFSKEQISKGFTLDIVKNDDKTFSLVLLEGTYNATKELWRQPIAVTLKERDTNPISNERIAYTLKVGERLQEHVFGAEQAIEKVAGILLLADESRFALRKNWDDHTRATVLAFLGPSSTGKSETGKAIARELFPEYGEERRVDIDCNKIKNPDDVKTAIWGHGVGVDALISEFMLKYDQYDGDLIVVLEEFTNIPREVQRGFFDFLREPHPKFADGKDRPMTKVTVIITGNAGSEWYHQVPKYVPVRVQMAAWGRIYDDTMKDPEFQRATLDKYMPDPLINRIGVSNIVWFSPHTFKSIRELTLHKVVKSMKALGPSPGRRWWNVGFRSEQEFFNVIEIIEREGFYLHEQGASIDRYVVEQIERGLRKLLLTNMVADGTKVALKARADQTEELIKKNRYVEFDVLVEGRKEPLRLRAFAQVRPTQPVKVRENVILTGLHEAGHEIVGKALLGDEYRSKAVSIIEGVVQTGGKWAFYAGVRESEKIQSLQITRETIVRQIALDLGGAAAEQMYNTNGVISAGVHNDIEEATKLAENAILTFGISRSLGLRSFGADKSMMTETDRAAAAAEVKSIMDEAFALAKHVIQKNKVVFERMAYAVLEKGELKEDDLASFYARPENALHLIEDQRVPEKGRFETLVNGFLSWWKKAPAAPSAPNHKIKIVGSFKAPEVIASTEDIVKSDMKAQQAKALLPKVLPIHQNFTFEDIEEADSQNGSCDDMLRRLAGA